MGTAYAFILCTAIVQYLVWALWDWPGKAVWRLCKDCMEMVQWRCICYVVSTESAGKLYDARAGSVLRPRGDGAVTVQGSYNCHKSLQSPYNFLLPKYPSKMLRFLQDQYKAFARFPHNACTTSLQAVGLQFFFQICLKSLLNKVVEATAPVNSYKNCMVAVCLPTYDI